MNYDELLTELYGPELAPHLEVRDDTRETDGWIRVRCRHCGLGLPTVPDSRRALAFDREFWQKHFADRCM